MESFLKDFDQEQVSSMDEKPIRIKVIGVGGAGSNALDMLKLESLPNVSLSVVNTDSKTLSISLIQEKVQIGRKLTRGLSAGGEPEIGRRAAEDSIEELKKLVSGIDLVFIVAGLGGGSGSGASPVIAELAVSAGATVVAFVTQPFAFEGSRRMKISEESLMALRENCHAVIALPNDVLWQQVEAEASAMAAFTLADQWISRGVKSVCSLLSQHGLINVDFATLKTAFRHRGGKTLFGMGEGKGVDCVRSALSDLEMCPLLHLPENKYLRKTDSLIVNITGGSDLSMNQVKEILDNVTMRFGSNKNTVMGAVIENTYRQSIRITVIGTTEIEETASDRKTHPVSVQVFNAHRSNAGQNVEIGRFDKRISEKVSKKDKAESDKSKQDEFSFPSEKENRGFFDQTEKNEYEGEDLDIPTYLRRGIKVQL
jgi:cell division protein FtsZ